MTTLNPTSKIASLPNWFRDTEAGAEIECEILAIDRESREELIAEKTDIVKERGETMPALIKISEAKLSANKKAAEKLRQSEIDLNNSLADQRRANSRFNTSMSGIDRDLREGADPSIAAAINAWTDELHRIIRLKPVVYSGSDQRASTSNRDVLLSLRQPIRDAISSLEKLQLENPESVEREIEKIVTELHPIGSVDRNYAG